MDVIVVGAGIAGLSTAWALTRRGHRVTLLEQAEVIPSRLAASGDSHRIIRRAYPAASGYGRLITEAYEAWDEVWSDLGQSHYDPRGFFCVSREPGDEAEDYLEGMRAGDWPVEMLTADEAAARWPFLDPETIRYAYVSPDGGALHCRRIGAGLCEWLGANGADVRTSARVVSVEADAGTVELASGERLAAERIVVTAGAWILKLFPQLGSSLKTYRTAVAYVEPPADLKPAWAAAPVVLDVGGSVDGYIIPPSGDGGLKVGTGMHKWPTEDADADRPPREGEGRQILSHFTPPMARLDEYRVERVVTCAYTFTADERFFAADIGKALVVSACSGHGYKFGAAVGRRTAEAVLSGDIPRFRRWLRAESG